MKEIRNILGWLGMAQEQVILNDAQKHVEETYKTVSYFAEVVNAFIKGDQKTKLEMIDKVRQSEHDADILRAKMVNQLSDGLLLPPDRADMLHFVKTLDKIADWTNGAARLVGFIENKLPAEVYDNISKATDLIFTAVAKLKEAINAILTNDLKKALVECEEVARIEHEADDRKKTLIESIIHAKLEPTSLLLTYQLAEYLEGVTDKIEDAADFVKMLAIKSQ